MSEKVQYRLYDMEGRFLFLGSAPECARFLGINIKTFRRRVMLEDYITERTIQIERAHASTDEQAAENWDRFIAQFRKQHGIDR